MSYARARELADRLHRRARAAGNRQPNLFETYLMMYEIGQRNGYPMNKITAAIVSTGYVVTNAAAKLGSHFVSAVTSQIAPRYTCLECPDTNMN